MLFLYLIINRNTPEKQMPATHIAGIRLQKLEKVYKKRRERLDFLETTYIINEKVDL